MEAGDLPVARAGRAISNVGMAAELAALTAAPGHAQQAHPLQPAPPFHTLNEIDQHREARCQRRPVTAVAQRFGMLGLPFPRHFRGLDAPAWIARRKTPQADSGP